jgi:hypothetical protein
MTTIAQTLRALRPYLPEGFKKTKGRASAGYIYKELLEIEVFGLCKFDSTTKEKNECRATRIVVRPLKEYKSFTYPGELRAASYGVRKADKSFNLESIGERVQFILARLADCAKQQAERDAAYKKEQADKKALHSALMKIARANTLNVGNIYHGQRFYLEPNEFASIQNDHNSVTIHLNRLTLEQAERVLELIKEL